MVLKKFEVSEDAEILRKRDINDFSLIEAVFAPNLHVPNHGHEKACFGFVLQGACKEVYRATTREYYPLSVNFTPADSTHSVSYFDEPTLTFGIHIGSAAVEALRDYSLVLDRSLHQTNGAMSWLFARLYEEFRNEDSVAPLAIEGIAFELVAAAARERRSSAPDVIPPAWLQRVKDLLHARFLESLTLTTIAEIVAINPVHLCREYRRHYGATVGESVRRLRIEYACRQMMDRDIPLAQIALASGFADQSHFTRTFKRVVGRSPAVFRAALLNRSPGKPA